MLPSLDLLLHRCVFWVLVCVLWQEFCESAAGMRTEHQTGGVQQGPCLDSVCRTLRGRELELNVHLGPGMWARTSSGISWMSCVWFLCCLLIGFHLHILHFLHFISFSSSMNDKLSVSVWCFYCCLVEFTCSASPHRSLFFSRTKSMHKVTGVSVWVKGWMAVCLMWHETNVRVTAGDEQLKGKSSWRKWMNLFFSYRAFVSLL